MDIERDGGLAAVGGAVGVAAVDAAAGGEGEAVEGLVGVGVVRDRVAGVDLGGVVQAAEQPVVAEVEDLLGAVGGDAGGEGGVQPAPGLAVLLPRGDLEGLDAGVGEQERGGEVVPHPVAEEVADLQGTPRRVRVVAGVGGAGAGPAVDGLAVGGLKNDPFGVGVEGQALAGRGPGGEDGVLAAGVDGQGLVQERVGESLLSPERAADGQLDGECADARPPFEPAVRVEDEIQQVIHVRLISARCRSGRAVWLPEAGRFRRAGRSSRYARGTVRARKSRISAAISAALSSSAKWPVWSAWYSAPGWSVRICRTACSGKISSLAPVATSVGGRRSRRNCCMAVKTGAWVLMSYSRSSMISSTPGRSISALSMTQLSGSIREGSWAPDRYWPRSPSRSR